MENQTQTGHDRHPVLFVGAGPGDPDLITVKGKRALESADLVVYAGSLVPEALLKWTRPGITLKNSAGLHLAAIISEMETHFHRGERVVRLHTGDPSLYGAIFEQMAELAERGIPFKVIPGVTAAFAAAASLGMEFTLPEVSQTLILTRMAGRTPVPEAEALASLAAHRASMAIYLSIGLVDQVADILKDAYGPDAPCIVVYRASHPDEKIVKTTLKNLTDQVRKEKITRQALIIVGKVLDVEMKCMAHKSRLYDRHFSHGYRKAEADNDTH